MPRTILSRAYIAEGFHLDCDELIQRCLQADVLNYYVFCNIWKDMNFSQVFLGRQFGSELAELSEEVIHVAKTYFVENSSIEESVAGLFLVYGLLNIQPYSGFAPLRIVPDDIVPIKKLMMAARETNRLDVLYILGSVLIRGPVEFHAEVRDYGFELPLKKYLLGFASIDIPGQQRTRGVMSLRGEELNILRDINTLTNKYTQSKDMLTKTGLWSDKLNYSNSQFATDLDASFRNVLSGSANNEKDNSEKTSEKDSPNRLQLIKNRAMALNKNVARHRVGVEERKKLLEDKILEKTPSPQKSKIKVSRRKLKRRKRFKVQMSSDDTSDSDNPLLLTSSDESDDQTNITEIMDQEVKIAEKDVNIQLDSLPVLISVDRNKEYEFEIIDNMQVAETEEKGEQTREINPNINKRESKLEFEEPPNKPTKVETIQFEVPILESSKQFPETVTDKGSLDNASPSKSLKAQTVKPKKQNVKTKKKQSKDEVSQETSNNASPSKSPKVQTVKSKRQNVKTKEDINQQLITLADLITVDRNKEYEIETTNNMQVAAAETEKKGERTRDKNLRINKRKGKLEVKGPPNKQTKVETIQFEVPILESPKQSPVTITDNGTLNNASPSKSTRAQTVKSKKQNVKTIEKQSNDEVCQENLNIVSPSKSPKTQTVKSKKQNFKTKEKQSNDEVSQETANNASPSKSPKTKTVEPKKQSVKTKERKSKDIENTASPKGKGRKTSAKKSKIQNEEDMISLPRITRSSMTRLSTSSVKTEK